MRLFVFGPGYTASRIAVAAEARGARVIGTSRDGRAGSVRFDDPENVAFELRHATHVLSSVPPDENGDPVLELHRAELAGSSAWLGYLSSTGVYGDAGGAWVDEGAPLGGRRGARAMADRMWLALGARVFRLPGIYGPGRSALERVRSGQAHRIDLPEQVFSRVHVDDIVSGVLAGFDAPAGAYNLADDLPASQNAVVEFACGLLGMPPPPLQALDEAGLSPMARGFYAENRRVANGKAKRVLGWRPRYPDYRLGLRALNAMTSPASTSTAPEAASNDQR